MSEMKERMKRAIAEVDDGAWNLAPGIEEKLAHAALQALMEPTEDMIGAGYIFANHEDTRGVWQTMLRQAITG